jgi:hypothetical protein
MTDVFFSCIDLYLLTFPSALWLSVVTAKDLIKLQVKRALLSALSSNLPASLRIVSKFQNIFSTEDLQVIGNSDINFLSDYVTSIKKNSRV